MKMRRGDRWKCTNRQCKCEIIVFNSAEIEGASNPTCCCGGAMKKLYAPPEAEKADQVAGDAHTSL
jgi:hypothetical protein